VGGAVTAGAAGSSVIKINGDMIEFYQGGVMKAQIKLAVIAGVLSLAASGLPFSCDGITSSGDIKGQTVDPNWTSGDTKVGDDITFRAIAYGGGKFVAVGETSGCVYSTDGVTWTAIGTYEAWD
jgi:hypothetical protein